MNHIIMLLRRRERGTSGVVREGGAVVRHTVRQEKLVKHGRSSSVVVLQNNSFPPFQKVFRFRGPSLFLEFSSWLRLRTPPLRRPSSLRPSTRSGCLQQGSGPAIEDHSRRFGQPAVYHSRREIVESLSDFSRLLSDIKRTFLEIIGLGPLFLSEKFLGRHKPCFFSAPYNIVL